MGASLRSDSHFVVDLYIPVSHYGPQTPSPKLRDQILHSNFRQKEPRPLTSRNADENLNYKIETNSPSPIFKTILLGAENRSRSKRAKEDNNSSHVANRLQGMVLPLFKEPLRSSDHPRQRR
jgi:hypothetical protein